MITRETIMSCDGCEEAFISGPNARWVRKEAKWSGWTVSKLGHYCKDCDDPDEDEIDDEDSEDTAR